MDEFAKLRRPRPRGVNERNMALVLYLGAIAALFLPLATGMKQSTGYDCDGTQSVEVLDYEGNGRYFYMTVDLSNECQ